eukprot:3889972-Amphidinium_carterae.1
MQIRVLNRTLTWTENPTAIECAADKRHVTLFQQQFGFTPSSKSLSSPGAQVPVNAETSQPLEEELLPTF